MSRAKELVAAFDVLEGQYLREEVEEAIGCRDEITPLLIAILEEIASDPVGYVGKDHFAETYAVTLLAHFKEARAHVPIIQAFRIPDEQRDHIWGDMVTETLSALLCKTAGGDYSRIMEIVRDRNAYEYLRTAALEALKLGVASGELPRQEGIALFTTLFDETLAEAEDYFWESLVKDLLDIYPIELITEIRELYAKGFVFEGGISLDEVEKTIAAGLDATNARLEKLCERHLSEDVHSYMSWFACFNENKRETPKQQITPTRAAKPPKAKTQTKRKQAKASKRKNRK